MVAGALFGAALLTIAGPLAAADPFYLSRLREGVLAFERGEHKRAVTSLRIACFGLLEDPELLAECLVRLAVAAAEGGDTAGFEQAFHRIVEAEEIVGLYSQAELPADLQEIFERLVASRVAAAVMREFRPLSHLAAERRESNLEGLSPRQLRQELSRLSAAEPDEARWPLLMAQLEHDEDRPREASAAADHVLELDPQADEARCIRGWAESRLDRCAPAVDDLAACSWTEAADFALALLGCHVELEQWAEAGVVIEELPGQWASVPRIARLRRVVERQQERARDQEELAAAERGEAGDDLDSGAEPEAGVVAAEEEARQAAAVESALTADEESKLAAAEEIAGRARSAGELREAYQLLAAVAAQHPARSDLHLRAAEIAYRASRWQDAVRQFEIAGDPGDDEPQLLFYLAVSLYETGERQRAAETLRRCVDDLRRTPFVAGYVEKILGRSAGGSGGGGG